MKKIRTQNKFYITFTGLILVNVVLIFATRLLPFIDLPQHLAYATIHKYIGQAGNYFDQYFKVFPLFMKWNSFHPFFCGLEIWPSVEFGNRIFFSLYVILLPASVLYFIKKINGNLWLALLSFVLIYNFNVSWGFVGFIFAIPICIFTMAKNLDLLHKTRLQDQIYLTLLLLFIYHLHILSLFIITLTLFVQNIVYNKTNFKKIIRTSWPYLVGVFLLLYFIIVFTNQYNQVRTAERTYNNMVSSHMGVNIFETLKNIPRRLPFLIFKNHSYLFAGKKGVGIGLFFFSVIVSPIVISVVNIKKYPEAFDKKLLVIVGTIFFYLLIYLFYPGQILDWQRYSIFILLLLIVLGSRLFKFEYLSVKIIFVIISIIYFSIIVDYFSEYNKVNKNFTESLFKGVPKNKVLSGLMIRNKFRGKQYMFGFFPDYHIVWNKGIESLRLANGYPYYQLYRKVSENVLPDYHEHVGLQKTYYGRFNNVDFLLLRGELDDFIYPVSKKLIRENFKLYRKRGIWQLFKSKKIINNKD